MALEKLLHQLTSEKIGWYVPQSLRYYDHHVVLHLLSVATSDLDMGHATSGR
jgi:hypothetical protein